MKMILNIFIVIIVKINYAPHVKKNTKVIIALLIMKILIIFVLNIKSLLILIAKKVSKICVLHALKLIMPMKIFYMKKYH